jgi:acyl-CoA dehydrogenase
MNWKPGQLPAMHGHHPGLAATVSQWCKTHEDLLGASPMADFDGHCRAIVRRLAQAGLLEYVLPQRQADGSCAFDARAICLIREGLAYHSNLAATLFVLQGMGFAALLRIDDDPCWHDLLARARRGDVLGAIAVSEADAGSDVAAIATRARTCADGFILNGTKAWVANGSIADRFLVLAKLTTSDGESIAAFLVDATLPGVGVSAIEMADGCLLAEVRLADVRIAASARLGGDTGMKLIMAGFELYRPSVGAAALGLAKRALDETLARVASRVVFGRPLSDNDVVRARLAEMALDISSAELAVYHAAWTADVLGGRRPADAAMAKLIATEAAWRVIDTAVQLAGAYGVSAGPVVERLLREVRPMRIYEGPSEVQKLIIARALLRER